METTSERPGFLDATGFVDQLRRLEDASAAEVERINQVYREIERRDGAAQWHTQLWQRFALLLVVALLGTTGYTVYLAMQASRVQAFVQPVQITEEGKMILVGLPEDLLKYQPEDSAYMDLIAQYVTKRRWKGDENSMKRTRNDWAWLYRHSCGLASKTLANDEMKEVPFKPSPKRVSIDIKSITKTATPESYQILWHEVTVDTMASTLKEQDYVGTFTTGRIRPKDLREVMDNRLGLCVTGYDVAPRAGS